MSYASDPLNTDIISYLKRHENKELLRFTTVGSVDDGKSTLIGRMLMDTGSVYEDQLRDAENDGEVDLARVTDGLRAEREQGITIDVAYRYFTTPKRKFIIADTPGHIQYTRNMATGASTANVAIILIDARLGVLQQSRRHAFIASLLGIPHLLVAVNKMDLVDFGQERYDEIVGEFMEFASDLRFHDVKTIPVSALLGDNVVETSVNTPWYDGGTILNYLETVDIVRDRNLDNFRMPVQTVLRPNLDYRGFAGQVSSGIVKKGDTIVAMPSGKTSTVVGIDTYDGELDEAFAPQSVVLRLADEIDISRGDLICHVNDRPQVGRTFRAMMVWMAEQPLDADKRYLIKHTTSYVRADVESVDFRMDLNTMEQMAAATLALNDIGCVTLTTHRPICFDPYTDNRTTGAFIVIDSLTNNTVAAGMILDSDEVTTASAGGPRTGVSARERASRIGHTGAAVWLVGLPAAGKSTLAYALERRLFDIGALPAVIDPDTHASDLYEPRGAFDEAVLLSDRFADAGLIAVSSFTAGERPLRDYVREHIGDDRFVEVHVSTPRDVCIDRDARGLYASAGALEQDVSGINAPFDVPESPDVVVNLAEMDVDEAVEVIIATLREREILS